VFRADRHPAFKSQGAARPFARVAPSQLLASSYCRSTPRRVKCEFYGGARCALYRSPLERRAGKHPVRLPTCLKAYAKRYRVMSILDARP